MKSKQKRYSVLDKKIRVLLETKRLLAQQVAVLQVDKIRIKNEILLELREELLDKKNIENSMYI